MAEEKPNVELQKIPKTLQVLVWGWMTSTDGILWLKTLTKVPRVWKPAAKSLAPSAAQERLRSA